MVRQEQEDPRGFEVQRPLKAIITTPKPTRMGHPIRVSGRSMERIFPRRV